VYPRKWGRICAETGYPLKLPSPTNLAARLGHFPPASQAGRLAGPVFYVYVYSLVCKNWHGLSMYLLAPNRSGRGRTPLSLYFLSALQRHNTENSKLIFPEKALRGLSPYFHIHVSGGDLYIPKRNCVASFPISTFMCLWVIYIYSHDRSAYSADRKVYEPILKIYKSPSQTHAC
jgi:hypothetical protein